MPMKPAMRRCGRLAPLAFCLTAGCATSPATLELFPAGAGEERALSWPAPPEVPRYRYAGQLLGEANFPRERDASAGKRMLRWVVGIDGEPPRARALARPQGGMVDERGRIFVTDVGRQAVFVFDPAAGLSLWERADGGVNFVNPLGIAQGPNGQVLVSDAQLGRVVRLDAQGKPLGAIGAGVLQRPTGLVRNARTGLTYVADTAAHDIKAFDDAGRLVRTIGRRGTGPGEFNAPTFLALHGERLVVSDTLNARVQVLSAEGAALGVIGERGLYVGNLTRPKGVAVDDEGHVYVAESYYDHLLIFDETGRLLLPIGGSGTAPGRFFLPGGIWTDRGGRVFVADVFNARVVVFHYLGD